MNLCLPDLASSHYGKLGMKWYDQSDVNAVPKTANPRNFPELIVNEKYWAIINQKIK